MDKAWKLFLTWARDEEATTTTWKEQKRVLHVNLNNIEMCARGDVL